MWSFLVELLKTLQPTEWWLALRKILVNEKKSEDLDYLTVAEQTEGYDAVLGGRL